MDNRANKSDCGSVNCRCDEPQGVKSRAGKSSRLFSSLSSIIPSVLFAFFPKCAFCWASYLALFNSMGFSIPYSPWLKNIFLLFMFVSLYLLYKQAQQRQKWIPFFIQIGGISCLLLSNYYFHQTALTLFGLGAIISGTLLSTFTEKLTTNNFPKP